MPAELVVVVVVETLDCSFLDRAVHPLDLTIRPRMLHSGESVLDAVVAADAVEDVFEGVPVLLAVGKLDAVVGEHSVNGVGNGGNEVAQELGGYYAGLFMQLRVVELRGQVDDHRWEDRRVGKEGVST